VEEKQSKITKYNKAFLDIFKLFVVDENGYPHKVQVLNKLVAGSVDRPYCTLDFAYNIVPAYPLSGNLDILYVANCKLNIFTNYKEDQNQILEQILLKFDHRRKKILDGYMTWESIANNQDALYPISGKEPGFLYNSELNFIVEMRLQN